MRTATGAVTPRRWPRARRRRRSLSCCLRGLHAMISVHARGLMLSCHLHLKSQLLGKACVTSLFLHVNVLADGRKTLGAGAA